MQGHHILAYLRPVAPQDSEPPHIIWSYADLNLQTLASAGLLKTRPPLPQLPSPGASHAAMAGEAPAESGCVSPGAASQSTIKYSSPAQTQARCLQLQNPWS